MKGGVARGCVEVTAALRRRRVAHGPRGRPATPWEVHVERAEAHECHAALPVALPLALPLAVPVDATMRTSRVFKVPAMGTGPSPSRGYREDLKEKHMNDTFTD